MCSCALVQLRPLGQLWRGSSRASCAAAWVCASGAARSRAPLPQSLNYAHAAAAVRTCAYKLKPPVVPGQLPWCARCGCCSTCKPRSDPPSFHTQFGCCRMFPLPNHAAFCFAWSAGWPRWHRWRLPKSWRRGRAPSWRSSGAGPGGASLLRFPAAILNGLHAACLPACAPGHRTQHAPPGFHSIPQLLCLPTSPQARRAGVRQQGHAAPGQRGRGHAAPLRQARGRGGQGGGALVEPGPQARALHAVLAGTALLRRVCMRGRRRPRAGSSPGVSSL